MDPPMPLNSNIRPKVEGQRFPQVGGTCFLKTATPINQNLPSTCGGGSASASNNNPLGSGNGSGAGGCGGTAGTGGGVGNAGALGVAGAGALGGSPSSTHLAALFECPVCFDYVLPPILQCQNGHLVCCVCREKLSCCPTCRAPIGNIRNLAMEKVAASVSFPCKFQSNGCHHLLSHAEKVGHEEVCEFRPYSCPCPGASCKWLGSLDMVMAHLTQQHKSITTLQGEDIVFLATDINLPGAVDWVMMQSCFGQHFMLVLEKQEKYEGYQQFFAIVQIIGSRKQAENFVYRLELNGNKRRLTWEATPRSIHEGVQSAIMNNDCLVFDTSVAKFFADNGNLGINVTINVV
ncbi:E3 ubiquitin-protein ligase SIAH1-like isoform X3 [Varroa jacobsoni]|nr:E3 ubiquitin-protein ligase SIAH1-like isoform X2 [Varroa destructor]XP_022692901.1 E3 ubiquitin-protein ligase SIAH1-like isoform X3 [Varroa jacobsoni]